MRTNVNNTLGGYLINDLSLDEQNFIVKCIEPDSSSGVHSPDGTNVISKVNLIPGDR
jgi:hypothetical protein